MSPPFCMPKDIPELAMLHVGYSVSLNAPHWLVRHPSQGANRPAQKRQLDPVRRSQHRLGRYSSAGSARSLKPAAPVGDGGRSSPLGRAGRLLRRFGAQAARPGRNRMHA